MISCVNMANQNNSNPKKAFSLDGNTIHLYSSEVKDTIDIVLFSDTHLSMKDAREIPYEQYSNRMGKAYTTTSHFQTREQTSPQQSFIETVEIATEKEVDLLAMLGDIFSYPSEKAIEWVSSILNQSQLEYVYTTGNHDWHYEGMKGSLNDLRESWINNRLLPLYKGKNPLYYSIDIKGVKILVIDNSTYEISLEQLDFFRQQTKFGVPLVLMMHIPLYAQGRPVNYGCAHPDWNKANDNLYELERRMPWAEKGHTNTTFQFREEVLNSTNLLAVFSGHIHKQSLDVINGLPLFVIKENASGHYFNLKILPIK